MCPLPYMAVTTENKSVHSMLPSICKYTAKAVFATPNKSPPMPRPTNYGASRLVQPMPAWSVRTVKTTRSPPPAFKPIRVHGHSASDIHHMGLPPPPLGRWKFRFSMIESNGLDNVTLFVAFPAEEYGVCGQHQTVTGWIKMNMLCCFKGSKTGTHSGA